MANNLNALLLLESPTALLRIEQALRSQDELSPDQEAVLGALIWLRCTSGSAGLLGCVLHQDCAKLIDDLPDQLARIGATDAAEATRKLRNAIPLNDERIKYGLVDWIDTQPDICNKARELDEGLNEVDQTIWDFMKGDASDIPDLEIPTRINSILSSVAGIFRSSGEGPASVGRTE